MMCEGKGPIRSIGIGAPNGNQHSGAIEKAANLHMVGVKAVSLLTTLLKSGDRGVPEYASRTYVRSYWQDGASAPAKTC